MAERKVLITFGMIVLNGEPFTRYNLRSLYPWAHQIIVVEGACPAASLVAGKDGHSTDGTLEALRRFQREEDPEGKVIVVTAEDEGHPDGFWPGEKGEMSRAYAKRATGSYLWQVDVDEFYRDEDMPEILALLEEGVDAVTFPTLSFWGGMNFLENGEYFIAHGARDFDRTFAWGAGYRYATHRPPTVCDPAGVDTRRKRWVKGRELRKRGIYLYHYSMLLPKQVREKCSYYARVDWASFERIEQWAEEVFFSLAKPFAVCNSLHCPVSWIERFTGRHPSAALEMADAIASGKHPGIEPRQGRDIDLLLETAAYRRGRFLRRLRVYALLGPCSALRTLVGLLKRSPLHPVLRRLYRSYRARLQRLKEGRAELAPGSRPLGLDRGRAIDRYYLGRFLLSSRDDIKGRVLEIGSSRYTNLFAGGAFSCEVLHVEPGHPQPAMVGDLASGAGIAQGAYDCLLLTHSLPLLGDVRGALRHAHAALKPGGVLLAALPGTSRGGDGRFTTASAERLFSEAFGTGNVRVESFGNAALADDPDDRVLITVRAVHCAGGANL